MITLAAAQPIEAAIKKHLLALKTELYHITKIEYNKDSAPIFPARKVEEVFAEMDVAVDDLIKLTYLRDKANIENSVNWDGKTIPISTAIQTAKSIRERIEVYNSLANEDKNPKSSRYSEETISVITYDPDIYKAKVKELTKKVNALSIAIDMANAEVKIDFDASNYLDGLG